jgi:hypothetical protein
MGNSLCQLFRGKGLLFRIYKELKTLKTKKKNPINKWTNKLNTVLKSRSINDKYMKKYLTFFAVKVMQLKRTLRFHPIPVRMAIIKNTTNADKDVGKKGNLMYW